MPALPEEQRLLLLLVENLKRFLYTMSWDLWMEDPVRAHDAGAKDSVVKMYAARVLEQEVLLTSLRGEGRQATAKVRLGASGS